MDAGSSKVAGLSLSIARTTRNAKTSSGSPRALRTAMAVPQPVRKIAGHVRSRFSFPAWPGTHDIDRLAALGIAKTFPKGTLLCKVGDKSEGVYVVLEGRVKLSLTSSSGKELVLAFYGPRTVVGLPAAVLNRTHQVAVETLMPTNVAFITRKKLVAQMQEPAAARWVADLACDNWCSLFSHIAAMAFSQSADQKLAHNLLRLIARDSSRDGESVHLDMTQETMGQMVGLSRETVSRSLSRLRKKGVLDWTRSEFVIRDRRALEILGSLP
jgi:CRP/FNR family transcriptional regulator, cyclic AMP receptor protein